MRCKAHSWRDKIDPSFDRFIRSFLDLIRALGFPVSEGYVHIGNLDAYFSEVKAKDFPSVAEFYDDQDIDNILLYFKNLSDHFIALEEINTVYQKIDWQEFGANIESEISRITIYIREGSKPYYRKWKFIPNPEIDLKEYIHFISDLISLSYHLLTISENGDNRSVMHVKAIQRMLFMAWEVTSWYINKKPLKELYNEAKKGSDESLFKLAEIDKTIVDHEWARTRIRKAMYLGDSSFFKSFSKAIRKDPLSNRKLKIELHLVLMHFWYYGLYRLTIPELMKLLEDSGIKMQEGEVTFRKFIDREIKPYFGSLYLARR